MRSMHPHPALSLALMNELHTERSRVRRRFRPSGGAAVRMFRPLGHGARRPVPAACAGCLNG
jgi:hypothetical protein